MQRAFLGALIPSLFFVLLVGAVVEVDGGVRLLGGLHIHICQLHLGVISIYGYCKKKLFKCLQTSNHAMLTDV